MIFMTQREGSYGSGSIQMLSAGGEAAHELASAAQLLPVLEPIACSSHAREQPNSSLRQRIAELS